MIPNIFASISGDPKTGKTHLALTFPDPIVVYSFDLRGAELLLDKPVFKDKKIEVRKFMPPICDTLTPDKEAPLFWDSIKDSYRADIESGKFKTVVVDPATMLWEIIRNAWTVENDRQRLLRRDYGVPNARMTWILTSPLVVGMNVASVTYLKDVYVDDKATGAKEVDGFKRTQGLADIVLLTEMIGKKEKVKVKTTIEHCRFDRELNGVELTDTDYSELMTLLGVE